MAPRLHATSSHCRHRRAALHGLKLSVAYRRELKIVPVILSTFQSGNLSYQTLPSDRMGTLPRQSAATSRRGLTASVALFGTLLTFLGGCSLFPWQSSRYGGERSEVYFLDIGRDEPREVTYTLRLRDNVADIFFAFVNYSDGTTPRPTVTPW